MPGFNMGPMMQMYSQMPKPKGKETEFARGLYIYDFEECITAEMLFKHFNSIKPVEIIKFPRNKQR